MEAPTIDYPLYRHDVVYGSQHGLQNLDLCLPRPLEESDGKDTVWVIFIHGGAWRDPLQNKSELHPALSQLLAAAAAAGGPASTIRHIAGFASLNYGLSRHALPGLEDGSPGSRDPALRVRHPQHVLDVRLALSFLLREYRVGAPDGFPYLCVGHSAGATLAFQTLTYDLPADEGVRGGGGGGAGASASAGVNPPVGIAGLAGIYSLPLLVRNHARQPFYRQFVTAAFGDAEAVWAAASPAVGKAASYRKLVGGAAKAVVLGWSPEDVLVEAAQWEEMRRELVEAGWTPGAEEGMDAGSCRGREEGRDTGSRFGGREVRILRLEGPHDQIWKAGTGVRRSIEVLVEMLFGREA